MSEFTDYLTDVFATFGAISARKMFGGHGIYFKDCMFGLVADDMLYLKVDEQNLKFFEEFDLPAFEFTKSDGRPMKMSFYLAPESIYEDQDDATAWAEHAWAAASRAKAKKRSSASRSGAKKSATRPITAKKAIAKKTTAKKTTANMTAANKTTAKKKTAKKTTANKTTGKTRARKSSATKTQSEQKLK